jgi:hypothetical protein
VGVQEGFGLRELRAGGKATIEEAEDHRACRLTPAAELDELELLVAAAHRLQQLVGIALVVAVDAEGTERATDRLIAPSKRVPTDT